MPQVGDDIGSVERLSQRIADLEARVSALEDLPAYSAAAEPESPTKLAPQPSVSVPRIRDISQSGSIVPVVGYAVLAMAGAYLLRAIAESSPATQFPMLMAAVGYAGLWMAWAVRSHRTSHFASAVYGTTATIILAPLLYESTVRFELLSVGSASAVLVSFVVLVLILAWHGNLQVLPWVATLASIGTVWALMLTTHELVPLTSALLAIALATEIAACLGHRISLWAMVAIAADAGVSLFIYVMTLPDGVPSSYLPASATTTALLSVSLLGIYGGGIAIRSFGERKRISNFEVFQGMVAFLLASFGALRASRGSASPLLGSMFILCSCVCYWGALWRFSDWQQLRNRTVSASWAVLLMVAGIAMIFSPRAAALLLCLLAIAVLLLHRRNDSPILAFHVSMYLISAALLGPYLAYGREALAGTVPGLPQWSIWILLASAFFCYSAAPQTRDARWSRLLWITPAALAGFGVASLAVVAVRALIATRFELNASLVGGLRSVVICITALALAVLSTRYQRAELGWLAYAAVGLGALKLVFEDLRFGSAASLVVSFLFYGLMLVTLPRFMRSGESKSASAT